MWDKHLRCPDVHDKHKHMHKCKHKNTYHTSVAPTQHFNDIPNTDIGWFFQTDKHQSYMSNLWQLLQSLFIVVLQKLLTVHRNSNGVGELTLHICKYYLGIQVYISASATFLPWCRFDTDISYSMVVLYVRDHGRFGVFYPKTSLIFFFITLN